MGSQDFSPQHVHETVSDGSAVALRDGTDTPGDLLIAVAIDYNTVIVSACGRAEGFIRACCPPEA